MDLHILILAAGVGKLDGSHLHLPGAKMVSRQHCRLTRVDFGPSRWAVHDNHSTNGIRVNDKGVRFMVKEHRDAAGIRHDQLLDR